MTPACAICARVDGPLTHTAATPRSRCLHRSHVIDVDVEEVARV